MQQTDRTDAQTRRVPPLHYIVGRDVEGHWLAIESHNRAGGLFRSRADAIHFAVAETSPVSGIVEFADAPLRLAL